jgi:hypothetical protein
MLAYEGCMETYIHKALQSWSMDRVVCPTEDQFTLLVNIVADYVGSELLPNY